MRQPRNLWMLTFALLVCGVGPLAAQRDGITREQMWSAPTAEDWAKPVLIKWQRTWEDALAVSKETGKPILVCTNMDGEIASEHYAGIRYRQPDIAKLYEPYVCVIASVYRHNPRDYDEQGRRIPCPRFGCVTCGEHIAIEPVLYAKFMEGQRVAPRHIMVELDGKETYDVFYAFDTDSVFKAIKDGIEKRPVKPNPIVKGDRSILERVASREFDDRVAVEDAYRQGDKQMRKDLLEAAAQNVDAAPVDLLRLGVFSLDVDLSRMAREALARSQSANSVDLISEALAVPMSATEREALIASLGRLGDKSPKARSLAVVYRGLANRSERIDSGAWSKAIANAVRKGEGNVKSAYERESRLDAADRARAAKPKDPAALLDQAEAALEVAVDPKYLNNPRRQWQQYSKLMFQDAQRIAKEAEALGAKGWRVDAILGLTAHYLGNARESHARAKKAVDALPEGDASWNAMAVLGLFAESRMQGISQAVRRKNEWPGEWLTDVHAAYSILQNHPMTTDGHIVAYYDFLRALGGRGQSDAVLDRGLVRFPDSWALHDRLRSRILRQRGIRGLLTAYDGMIGRENASKGVRAFAGYASIVAAEFYRRRGREKEAIDAYQKAIVHYDAAVAADASMADNASHFAAVAHGGLARVAYEGKRDAEALAHVLASFERRPMSANSLDGLNISTVDTAKMLRARFVEQKAEAQLAKLQKALDALDPSMLQLPAYEGVGRDGRRRGNRGGGRRR